MAFGGNISRKTYIFNNIACGCSIALRRPEADWPWGSGGRSPPENVLLGTVHVCDFFSFRLVRNCNVKVAISAQEEASPNIVERSSHTVTLVLMARLAVVCVALLATGLQAAKPAPARQQKNGSYPYPACFFDQQGHGMAWHGRAWHATPCHGLPRHATAFLA